MGLTRRELLKTGLFASAALALPVQRAVSARWDDGRIAESRLPRPFQLTFRQPPVAVPIRRTADTDYYRMTMRAFNASILPGLRTPMFGYEGLVPGPTIRATRGRKVVVRHVNALPAAHPTLRYEPWTSVHLHGSASLPQYDGYASDITRPGQYKDYHYPNFQPGRLLWYHDHGVHHTAENVYQGLFAAYVLNDPLSTLKLPSGAYDVPLIVHDAMFKTDGSLLFSLENSSGMWGDVILVNGVPWPTMKVEPRKYRFRVLDGSISRSYRFSFDNGMSVQMIATDGGLMPAPQTVTSWRQGGAERYEFIVDFSKHAGKRIVLRNTSPTNNQDYTNTDKVMAFDVTLPLNTAIPEVPALPARLTNETAVMDVQASEAVQKRDFRLERTGGEWTVNGVTWRQIEESGFAMAAATPTEGTVEQWEIRNSSGGWNHPFHIHLIDFQILSRNGQPAFPWERGPKDVVYVGENETVQLLARFEGRGRYMMHCHNLVHEDHDMMSQFEVISADGPGDDPMGTRAKPTSGEAADALF